MPKVKSLAAFGLAKESVLGTPVAPTRFLNVDSEGFVPEHDPIMMEGLSSDPHTLRKVQLGARKYPGSLSLMLDPESIGLVLKAGFGSEGVAAGTAVGTHTFVRLAQSVLPTFTFWKDTKLEEYEFTGCQCDKLSISGKAREAWKVSASWVGVGRGTSLGTQAVTYGTVQPFAFSQTTFLLAGTANPNVDSFSLQIENAAKADHALGTSPDPSIAYAESFKVSGAYEVFYETLTELEAFMAGNRTSIRVTLTHAAAAAAGQFYSLQLDMPDVYYKAFPHPVMDNVNGPFKATVGWVANKAIGSSYGLQATLVNRDLSAY